MNVPQTLFGQGFVGATGSKAALVGNGIVSEKKKKWPPKIKHPGICTGEKLGSKSCPKGSRQYNLAKAFKKGSETSAAHRKAKSHKS